jgi:molybdopterin-binding protein
MTNSYRPIAIRRRHPAEAVLLSILLMLLLAGTVFAQELPGKISGRVLGLDGKALAGARVTLQEIGRAQSLATVSDDSGHFVFPQVPPGLYSLSAEKGAYVSQLFSAENAIDTTPIRVEAGATLSKIDLRLEKGAVITGKITEENGEPVVLASVEAIELGRTSAPPRDTKQARFLTDDRGIYRLFGLPPGRYLISAHQTSLAGRNQEQITSYYPGVSSQRMASLVEVTAGAEVTNVDFAFKRRDNSPGVLRGLITLLDGTALQAATIYAYTRDSQATRVSATPQPDGSYEFTNLPSGSYTVEVLTRDQGLVERTRTTALVSSSAATETNVVVDVGGEITGRFEMEDGSRPKVPSGLSVAAWAEDGGFQVAARVLENGDFTISRLPGGIVRLVARAWAGPYYVVRIVHKEASLQDGSLSLIAGERLAGIRVILSDEGAMLRGTVSLADGRNPAPGSWVLLMPIEGTRRDLELLSRSVRVDQRGQYVIEGIAPGRYFVLACLDPKSISTDPSIWGLMEADNPGSVRQVELKAKAQQELPLRIVR